MEPVQEGTAGIGELFKSPDAIDRQEGGLGPTQILPSQYPGSLPSQHPDSSSPVPVAIPVAVEPAVLEITQEGGLTDRAWRRERFSSDSSGDDTPSFVRRLPESGTDCPTPDPLASEVVQDLNVRLADMITDKPLPAKGTSSEEASGTERMPRSEGEDFTPTPDDQSARVRQWVADNSKRFADDVRACGNTLGIQGHKVGL
ncbi:hypothetical protein EV426DRAFT_621588, partial [Tirmania nivea]